MVNQLTCKKCKGIEFKQIAPDTYECLDCSTKRKITHKRIVSKKRHEIPKESISISKKYKPINIFCESCGLKIERIGSPTDFKRLKNKWEKHSCSKEKTDKNLYF
jgi:rubredoxin